MGKDAKRAAKLESRASILTSGLQKRNSALWESLAATAQQLADARIASSCYSMLLAQERLALPARLDRLEAEVSTETAREAELQARYAALLEQRAALVGGAE